MSLLPFLLDYDAPRPRRLLEQHFGLGLTPEDLLTLVVEPSHHHQQPALNRGDYYRPWRNAIASLRDVGSSIKSDKEKFQVNLDVQHFAPEEISVKTADGYVIVEGKHEEKQDQHGFVSRQFTRRYLLPEGCEIENVQSRLSSDGVLSVEAPRKRAGGAEERMVRVERTGPVRKEVKDDSAPQKNANGEMETETK